MDVSRVTVNSEMFDKTSVRVELTDVTITDMVGVENRKARGSPVLVIHVQFTARLLLNLLSMHADYACRPIQFSKVSDQINFLSSLSDRCMCVWVRARACVYVCVRACARAGVCALSLQVTPQKVGV